MKKGREQYTTTTTTTITNGVLVARGDRENSNPAKTTTHSGTVEKGDPLHKCCGKKVREQYRKWGAKIVVYLKWGFGEWTKLAIRIKQNEQGKGTISTIITNGVLVVRGGRENSNPAKTTTHSGTVEKETHFINIKGQTQLISVIMRTNK